MIRKTLKSQTIKSRLKKITKSIKLIFTPIAILSIIYIGLINRNELKDIMLSAELIPLFMSIVLWSTLHIISPLLTTISFKIFDQSISYSTAFKIHNKRLPAKYIPGGIWHTIARGSDYQKEGYSLSKIGKYFIFENIIIVTIALTLGCVLLSRSLQGALQTITLTLITAWIIVLTVPIAIKISSHRLAIKYHITKFYYPVLITTIYWLIAALSFVFFISSFRILSFELDYSAIGGTYLLSWGIGYIAIFAPQGVGVSEYVSATILKGNIQTASLIPTIAAFRAVVLIGDIIAWSSTFIPIKKLTKKSI